jgi:diadenosine tetraphosphate (Ap4A) HIT family hydrolase
MSVFLQINPSDYLFESNNYFVVYDRYPVTKGHTLIISKKPKTDFFMLSKEEQADLNEIVIKTKEYLDGLFKPDGYNIGMNCGEAAGQTIFHFHCHVIPRYNGDMSDPRGGVRHCVEGKGYYNP